MIGLGLAGFGIFGVVLVLIGSHQAELSAALQLDLASSGLLAASLSAGLGLGTIGSGPIVDRISRRRIFVTASLSCAASLLGFHADVSFAAACAMLGVLGLGLGAYETLLNTAIAQRYGTGAARPLTLVHSAATASAVLAPLGFAWLAARADWTLGFRLTGGCFLLLALYGGFLRYPEPTRRARGGARGGTHPPLDFGWALLAFALVGVCYVGIETAVTLFAVPWVSDGLALAHGRGIASISAFWLGLFSGRLALLLWRGRVDGRLLVACGLAGALLLGGGIPSGVRAPEALTFGVGACLGAVFPVMIALTAQRFPTSPGTATGVVAGAGAFGGFVIPWLTGWIGDRSDAGTALATLALWSITMAVAAWVTLIVRPRLPRPSQPQSPEGAHVGSP